MRHTLTFSGLSSVVLLVVCIIYKSEIAMTLIFWIKNRKIRLPLICIPTVQSLLVLVYERIGKCQMC